METIERSIDLDVPVQVAYQRWTRFEEFPRFMEGVEEVRRLDAKRLHWVATIGGTRKEWDAQITEEVPNERIAWRSEAGECTAGLVTFQPLGNNRTRITVRLEYEPQGVKETVGDWLGLVSRRVEHDLERFKAYVEGRGQAAAEPRPTTATAERTQPRTSPVRPPRLQPWTAGLRTMSRTSSDTTGRLDPAASLMHALPPHTAMAMAWPPRLGMPAATGLRLNRKPA